MEPLDLPPEIVDKVVHFFVKKYGIAEAWEIRGTCGKYSYYAR